MDKYVKGQYVILIIDGVERVGHIKECDPGGERLLIESSGDLYERSSSEVKRYPY